MPAAITAATVPAPHLVRVGTAAISAQAGPPVLDTVVTGLSAASPPVREADPAAPLLRVERGTATPEEVAAVTAVLFARAAAARAAAEAGEEPTPRASARWRVQGFAGPRAWTADARDLLAG
jgi:hypothetical protein